MNPYHQQDGITIYLGDFRDVLSKLPTDCADLLISDIPYGQSYVGTGFRKLDLPATEIAQDDGSFDLTEFIKASLRVVRPARHLYIFSPADLLGYPMLSGVTELIWDKEMNGTGDVSSLWAKSHEKVIFAVNGKRYGVAAKTRGNLAGRLRRSTVLRCTRLNGSGVDSHLTGKPVLLLRGLIEASSFIGETVIDPCMGTGSTLEAALREGRHAIGVDIDERNCEKAAERIGKLRGC